MRMLLFAKFQPNNLGNKIFTGLLNLICRIAQPFDHAKAL